MLLLTLIVGALLFSCRKYQSLRKKLVVSRKDVEKGQKRNYVPATDMTHSALFPQAYSNTRCSQISFTEPQSCTLGKSVEHGALPSKCVDSFHLALERAKRLAAMEKDDGIVDKM